MLIQIIQCPWLNVVAECAEPIIRFADARRAIDNLFVNKTVNDSGLEAEI